jgi:hypothetical protein
MSYELLKIGSLTVSLVPNEGGESEKYEAYNMRWVDDTGRLVRTIGIRKDRDMMRMEYRQPIDAVLTALKGKWS